MFVGITETNICLGSERLCGYGCVVAGFTTKSLITTTAGETRNPTLTPIGCIYLTVSHSIIKVLHPLSESRGARVDERMFDGCKSLYAWVRLSEGVAKINRHK